MTTPAAIHSGASAVASAIASSSNDSAAQIGWGTITAVTASTVSVSIRSAATSITGVAHLATYNPTVGDVVALIEWPTVNGQDYLVLCSIGYLTQMLVYSVGGGAHVSITHNGTDAHITPSTGQVVIDGNENVTGNLSVSGTMSLSSLSVSGTVTAGAISTNGSTISGNESVSGQITSGSASTGSSYVSGNETVVGTLSAGSVSASGLTATSSLSLNLPHITSAPGPVTGYMQITYNGSTRYVPFY